MNENAKHSCLPNQYLLRDRYRIRHTLSVSDLSIVYIATDMTDNCLCTVKEFFPGKQTLRDLDHQSVVFRYPSLKEKYQRSLETFFNEALIIKELHHPNITRYRDHFPQNNTGYIVTEFCKGKTLEHFILKEQNISIRYFLKTIFMPLLDAVDSLHRKGILHRDLKPSNIILNKKNEPVIIDFGSAVKYRETSHKTIFITPGFSPLEFYATTTKQGRYSDLYSLSATLYYYLCGKPPVEVSQRVIEDPIENVTKYNDLISPFLARAIMKNLSIEPRKRFNSVKRFKRVIYRETFWVK